MPFRRPRGVTPRAALLVRFAENPQPFDKLRADVLAASGQKRGTHHRVSFSFGLRLDMHDPGSEGTRTKTEDFSLVGDGPSVTFMGAAAVATVNSRHGCVRCQRGWSQWPRQNLEFFMAKAMGKC